jgi:hypothetical protein
MKIIRICLLALFSASLATGRCPEPSTPFVGKKSVEKDLQAALKQAQDDQHLCDSFVQEASQAAGIELPADAVFTSKEPLLKVVAKLAQYPETPSAAHTRFVSELSRVPEGSEVENVPFIQFRECNQVPYFKLWKSILASRGQFMLLPEELALLRAALKKYLWGNWVAPATLVSLVYRLSTTAHAIETGVLDLSESQKKSLRELEHKVESFKSDMKKRNEGLEDSDPAHSIKASKAERCDIQRRFNKGAIVELRQVERFRNELVTLLEAAPPPALESLAGQKRR